jgi:hypothetical protein
VHRPPTIDDYEENDMSARPPMDITTRPGVPFANGTEWDAWSANWCRRCDHERGAFCPVLGAALTHPDRTPNAWIDNRRASLGDQYICQEFAPRTRVGM